MLCFARDAVRLVVADDGQGSAGGESNGAASTGGFGLSALRERVQALGGTIISGDRPEGGFSLAVELPTGPDSTVRP